MRDLGGVKEDTILNNPPHLVTRVGRMRMGHVKEVTVDGRHAVGGGLAHRTGGLLTLVDGVVGEVNFYFVLRPTEGQDVDRGEDAVAATADCVYVKPFFTGPGRGSRGDLRSGGDHGKRRRGGRCNIDHRDNGHDSEGGRGAKTAGTSSLSQISHWWRTPARGRVRGIVITFSRYDNGRDGNRGHLIVREIIYSSPSRGSNTSPSTLRS